MSTIKAGEDAMSEKPRTVPQKMRSARLKLKFTREQVVSLLAISAEEYTAYEVGSKPIPDSIIDDLVDLYGESRMYWTPKKSKQSLTCLGSVEELVPKQDD